jgi:hypothetical protein
MSRNDKAPAPFVRKGAGAAIMDSEKGKKEKKENIYVTPKGRDSG